MQRKAIRKRKLSVFTYFIIFIIIVGITSLTIKELDISSGFEEILYQKDIKSNVEQENKYYINKIKNEYGIIIGYGEEEKSFVNSVDANIQYDVKIREPKSMIRLSDIIRYINNAMKQIDDELESEDVKECAANRIHSHLLIGLQDLGILVEKKIK